ncbi:MAG: HPr family phosphocarrier protein [Faecalibacterium sp.]|jgi:phosphocarrier protein|nr:HPr family phosphocarrier protein [Faecalibacterium sp.]
MKSFQYVIQNEAGIHARPAGLLVKQAKQFDAACTLEVNGQSADIKKMIALLKLGVEHGMSVTVKAEGPDEELAVAALQKLMEENL